MQSLQILEDRLAQAGDGAPRIDALNELAFALARAGDAARALPLAREAEGLAREHGRDDALALSLCSIGVGHYLQAEYVRGLEYCLQALAIAETIDNPRARATALVSAAACHYQMGTREEALLALYQALEVLEINEASNIDSLAIRAHNTLAVILADKGSFAESETHYQRGLELAEGIGDLFNTRRIKVNYAGLHHQRGLIAAGNGDAHSAAAFYKLGIALCDQVWSDATLQGAYDEAHCAGTLGELYREMGDGALAFDYFDKMLVCGERMNNPHIQADALVNLGKTHMQHGNDARAKECLDRAVELASGSNIRRLIAEAFLSLSNWFEARGDHREALEQHKRFHALHEELLRVELDASSRARQVWLNFQRVRREANDYRARVEHLSRDNLELSERATSFARAALEDSLTGLSNRRHLDARLAEMVASAREYGMRLCLAIADVDRFKAINDNFSHTLGDAVLRTVAGMISAHCREGDVSARYGGDEFVVCLIGTPMDAAAMVFERLRSLVASHAWDELHPGLAVTLSIGVTDIRADDTVGSLMQRVDAALYRAKKEGRDRVAFD